MLNYFEIKEAQDIFKRLVKPSEPKKEEVFVVTPNIESLEPLPEKYDISEIKNIAYKEDRLTEILKKTCLRSGASWGMITDASGLPVSFYNVEEPDYISALTSIFLESLEKVRKIPLNFNIDYLSAEVNSLNKIVFKVLEKNDKKYMLVYFMPLSVEEKEEVLISSNIILDQLDER